MQLDVFAPSASPARADGGFKRREQLTRLWRAVYVECQPCSARTTLMLVAASIAPTTSLAILRPPC
ncbi:protein of unknown function (plasmid) [Cupriavidus taiwanensis]|nr:protein of unknown function [Cupriavidus taiwanensis]